MFKVIELCQNMYIKPITPDARWLTMEFKFFVWFLVLVILWELGVNRRRGK